MDPREGVCVFRLSWAMTTWSVSGKSPSTKQRMVWSDQMCSTRAAGAGIAQTRSVLVDIGTYARMDRQIQANTGELAIPFERSSQALREGRR